MRKSMMRPFSARAAVAVAGLGLLLGGSIGMAGATQTGGVVRQGKFNGWSYVAGRTPEGILVATVQYDHSSPASLRSYAALNRSLWARLTEGSSQIETQLTFARPMSTGDFRVLATTMSLDLQVSEVRTTSQQGSVRQLQYSRRAGHLFLRPPWIIWSRPHRGESAR